MFQVQIRSGNSKSQCGILNLFNELPLTNIKSLGQQGCYTQTFFRGTDENKSFIPFVF